MKGKRKPFEQEDYDKYDEPAKSAMAGHLWTKGHIVTVPEENYGADLYSEINGRKIYHEVEVSKQWVKGDHPYPTGSIPERKIRLKQMCGDNELIFWMLRSDLGRALCFNAKHMIDDYLIEVPNYKVKSGEYFYRIPKNLGKELDLYA